MAVVKIVELVGESKKSWEDAVQSALTEAVHSIRHISGVEVLNWTGDVDESGKIIEYKADVQIAFRVEPENN